MRRLAIAAIVLGLCACPWSAFAQADEPGQELRDQASTSQSPPAMDTIRERAGVQLDGTAQAGAIDPAQYQLGPGDVLELRLWGRVAREIPLEVDPEGYVHAPDLDPILVGGRSLAQVRADVVARVGRLFRGVSVDLRIAHMRRFKVYVTGEVKSPGAFEVTPVARASEAVALAIPQDQASRRNVTVRHRDGSVDPVDLKLFESVGDEAFNPFLRDGDVVTVPVATRFLSANGAFARPGRYELGVRDSLSTLLRLAGGPLPSADLSRSLLIRFDGPAARESTTVDLGTGSASAGVLLRDGDAVFLTYVPDFHRLDTVAIVGEISSPGSYMIDVGHARLSDLVRWSGGFRPRADAANLLVVRRAPDRSETDGDFKRLLHLSREQMTESEYSRLQTELAQRKNSFRVDWNRLQHAHDLDLLLADGDIVRVDPLVTSVRVDGQVHYPGLVEYVPGRTPDEYVRLAGGFTRWAARRGARVTRSGTGQVVPASSVNELRPGDVIWVPEVHDHDFWNIFREVIGVAGQVAVVVVAVRH